MNFFDELFTKKKEAAKASQKKGRDIGARKNANEKRATRPITNVSRSQANIASKENRHTKVLSRSNPDFSGQRGKSSRQTPGVFVDDPQEAKWHGHVKPKAVDSPLPPPPQHANAFHQLKTVNYNNNEVDLDLEEDDIDAPMSVTDLDNITFRRGQVAKSEQGQGQGEDLSRSSSVTNLNADFKNKGALSKVRKSASKDRLDKIVDKKPEKKVLTRNNNKIDGEHSYSTETLQEIESLQRQLQEMANEKTNLALQLGEQKGQMHTLENEIQNLKVIQDQLNQENSLLRNRLRDVSHSPLSDNEKQQLLLESHRHHSSAPASIATNLLDDGAGGDITACPTPDWDKHSSSNVSEVSVACLQDKINQMQETHYSTNEELQATLQELTELQRQLTELQQDNERLSEEKALMFDSLCRQTERLNDSRGEVESLKQLLYRDKDDTGQLESVVEREQKLVDLLKSAQDEREVLLLKQEQLNSELQDARGANLEQAAHNQQLAERVKTLESTLDAKHAEHKQLDQELALAKDQSSGRQIEINRLTDLLENARTKIIELEQDRALSDKSELDELLDNARKEKDALESEVAHLKEQVARSRNETEKLRDQISILQEECKVTRNNAKCTQSELEYKCEKLVAEKNTLSDQLQQLQEAANELQVQAQCQLEDKRQLSSVLSETQRNLSEAERRNLDLENELAELKRLRKDENEEWEKFQNDLLTSVRVANDFKTEAQQDLQKMIMENKAHRERVRQLEAQLDKMKGEPSPPEAIVAAEEMPPEDLTPNKERDSKVKSAQKSPKLFFKKPKFFQHTKGGYYVTTAHEGGGGGVEANEGGDSRVVQPSMSPPLPPEHDFVLDDLTLTLTDRPDETPNDNEAKPEGKTKKIFGLLPMAKGDASKVKDSRKMGFIKKHLSAQEQKDLHTLSELYAAIDPNIPEEDLTAEQKFIIKLKQMQDSNFEQTKQKPVAKKPKDNLAISKPLLNSVILNPKLKQIADDPTVRLVEDELPRDSVHPPPETFEFNGETQLRSRFDDVYRSNIEFRYYDVEDSRRTVQSFKPPDDTLTKKSRSMNDLSTHKEEFVQVSNFGVKRNISKSSNSLTNYVSSMHPIPSFGVQSTPGISPYSSDSSDIVSVENHDTKGSQDLNVTLEELYAKIDPNLSESQLTKEQKFVRQMKESLDDMGRKHTLKREQKKKGLIISGPTQQSVMNNPKLVSLIHDPKTIEVKASSVEPKENMFKKFLGRFKSKKAEPTPPKPQPPPLEVDDEVLPPPGGYLKNSQSVPSLVSSPPKPVTNDEVLPPPGGYLKNSQSVPSLVSSPPKPVTNADSLPSLIAAAPSENVPNAESVSSLYQTVIVNSDLNKIIETRNSALRTSSSDGGGSPSVQVKNFQEAAPIRIVETIDKRKTKDVWVDSYDVVVVRHRNEDAPKKLERMSVREKIERFSQLSTSSENEAKPRSPDIVPIAPIKDSSTLKQKHFRTTQMQTDVNLLSKGIDVRRPPANVPKKMADVPPPPPEFQDVEAGNEEEKPKEPPKIAEAMSVTTTRKKEITGEDDRVTVPPKKVEDAKKESTENYSKGKEPKEVTGGVLRKEGKKSEPPRKMENASITTLWKREMTEHALRKGGEEDEEVEIVPIQPRGKNRELSRLLMSKIEFTFGGPQDQSESGKGQQESKPTVAPPTDTQVDEEVEYAVPRNVNRISSTGMAIVVKPKIVGEERAGRSEENLEKEAKPNIEIGERRKETKEETPRVLMMKEDERFPTEEMQTEPNQAEEENDDLILDRPHILSIGGKEDLTTVDELKEAEIKPEESVLSPPLAVAKENSLNAAKPTEEATAPNSRKLEEANFLTFSFFHQETRRSTSPSFDGEKDQRLKKLLEDRQVTNETSKNEATLERNEDEARTLSTNSIEERSFKKPEGETKADDKPEGFKAISPAREKAEGITPSKNQDSPSANLMEELKQAVTTNEKKPEAHALLKTKVLRLNEMHLFPTTEDEDEKEEERRKTTASKKPEVSARSLTKDESDTFPTQMSEEGTNEKSPLKVDRSNETQPFLGEGQGPKLTINEKPKVSLRLKTKENLTNWSNSSFASELKGEENLKSTSNEKPEVDVPLVTRGGSRWSEIDSFSSDLKEEEEIEERRKRATNEKSEVNALLKVTVGEGSRKLRDNEKLNTSESESFPIKLIEESRHKNPLEQTSAVTENVVENTLPNTKEAQAIESHSFPTNREEERSSENLEETANTPLETKENQIIGLQPFATKLEEEEEKIEKSNKERGEVATNQNARDESPSLPTVLNKTESWQKLSDDNAKVLKTKETPTSNLDSPSIDLKLIGVSTTNEQPEEVILKTSVGYTEEPGEKAPPKINEQRIAVAADEVDHPHYTERSSKTTEDVVSYTLILKDGPVHIDVARQTSSTTDATDASFDIDDLDPNFGSQLNAKSPARSSTISSISSDDEAILRRLSMRIDADELVILRDAQKKYRGQRPKSDINEEDLKLIELARMKCEQRSTTSSSGSDFDDDDLELIEMARARYADPLGLTDDGVVIRNGGAKDKVVDYGPYLRPASDLDEEENLQLTVEMSHETNKIILMTTGDYSYLTPTSDLNARSGPKIVEITQGEDDAAINAKDIETALLEDDMLEKNKSEAPGLKPLPDLDKEDFKDNLQDDVFTHDKNMAGLVDNEPSLRRKPDSKIALEMAPRLQRKSDHDDDDVIIRNKNRLASLDDDDGDYIRPVSDFNEDDLKIIEMARQQEDSRPTSGLNEEDLKLIDMAKRRDSERRRSDAGSDSSPRIYDTPQRRFSLDRHSLESTDMYEPVYENFSKYFAESKKKEDSFMVGFHKPPRPLPRHPRSSGPPEKFDDFDSIGLITYQIMDLTKNLSSNEDEASEDSLSKSGTIPKKPKEQDSTANSEEAIADNPQTASSMQILYGDKDGEESSARSSSHTTDDSYLNLFKSPEQVVFENLSEADKAKPSGTFTLHFFKPDNISSDESSSSANNKVSFLRKKFESQESETGENRVSTPGPPQKQKTSPDTHPLKTVPKVSNLPKNQNQSQTVDEVGDTEVPPPTTTLGISPGSEDTSLENLRRNSRKSFENARSFFETTSSDRVGGGSKLRHSNREEPDQSSKDQ